MDKEIFIRTVNLIFFFFSAAKANANQKEKKDRERYCNTSFININLLFNNSCSEFIYAMNDYNARIGANFKTKNVSN